MVVVSTTVDGRRGRIIDLKLRWPTKIAAFFQPNEAAKTLKTTEVLLYIRLEIFMWWFGGLRRPKIGDRMRERKSPARGERSSEVLLRCER